MVLVYGPEVFQVYNFTLLTLFIAEPMLVDALLVHTVQLCVLRLAIANNSKLRFTCITPKFLVQFFQLQAEFGHVGKFLCLHKFETLICFRTKEVVFVPVIQFMVSVIKAFSVGFPVSFLWSFYLTECILRRRSFL